MFNTSIMLVYIIVAIIQAGLKPKFVDVDPNTLNISIKDLKKKLVKEPRQ